MDQMRSVYILQSEANVNRYYTGPTSNIPARLAAHNAGHCGHTASGRPWKVIVVLNFADEERAIRFERYLKIRVRLRVREAPFQITQRAHSQRSCDDDDDDRRATV